MSVHPVPWREAGAVFKRPQQQLTRSAQKATALSPSQAAAPRRSPGQARYMQHSVQQGMLCAPCADRPAAELVAQVATWRLLVMVRRLGGT